MLNLKFIQENKETVIERLAVKNFDAREPVDKIIELDNLRKALQQEAEAKQAEMNATAKEIGKPQRNCPIEKRHCRIKQPPQRSRCAIK